MRKLLLAAAFVAALPAAALAQTAAAGASLTMDTVLGTTMDEVKTNLTAMGYEVRKAEMEDGKIEVYFVRDRTMGEVYVNPQTGRITKLELE